MPAISPHDLQLSHLPLWWSLLHLLAVERYLKHPEVHSVLLAIQSSTTIKTVDGWSRHQLGTSFHLKLISTLMTHGM